MITKAIIKQTREILMESRNDDEEMVILRVNFKVKQVQQRLTLSELEDKQFNDEINKTCSRARSKAKKSVTSI